MDVNKLTPGEVVALLGRRGDIKEEMVVADIAAGAPVNPDGTVRLAEYAAWLVRELDGCSE